jgi:N-acetyl sugar amidotransferase
MDRSDTRIKFNNTGVCNHCERYDAFIKKVKFEKTYSKDNLRKLVSDIKRSGNGKDYDCVLGVSGGIDSSYLMYLTKKLGIRPLIVHCDNGWNSELAISNIQKIIESLNYDLITYVIEWEEFKELQRAYLKASVIDIEVLTDHAMMATLFKYASDFNIHYILDGQNFATEFTMPTGWNYSKYDLINIKAIVDAHSAVPIRSFPVYGIMGNTGKFTNVSLLNYIEYSKEKAIQTLSEKFGWRPYGAKHYESTFTKFYQGYILPAKFGIDKRRIHLSDLVRSGQMGRIDALKVLDKPPYDPMELEMDKQFVLKKLEFSEEEFSEIMAKPPVPHTAYPHAAGLLASALGRKKKFL